jgi:hypothetical protein
LLNRLARATLVALLVGLVSTLGAIAPARAAARVPRVVFIVGPVGDLTAAYRAQADEAAAIAADAGAQVVRIYSPDATWPAVEQAVRGASIVVYLGHGNGWPSRYRDSLFPATQDGFGLNPVAGVDDDAHQYFGEASTATLQLAPNAVVLLHHLCYASGNTEPGLPEGTQDQAIERVDNYAAGFLAAGAGAVIAEGHLGPSYYVKALLTSRRTVEQIWAGSPAAHGNAFTVPASRTPGFVVRLDPDAPSGGYFRSIVSAGLTAAAVRAGATGRAGTGTLGPPVQPSLAGLGLRFGSPSLDALPIAGTMTRLALPFAGPLGTALPAGIQVGIRWDSILVDPPIRDLPSADAGPAASGDPGNPTPEPGTAPPEVELVAPERVGTVVTLSPVKATGSSVTVEVEYPAAPGLYRLVTTLHTPAGIAYDAATQALLTSEIVRVAGPVAVAYGVAPSISMAAGAAGTVPVRVMNAGTEAWDEPTATPPAGAADDILTWLRTGRAPAHLVATWLSTGGLPVPAPVTAVIDPSGSEPGGAVALDLALMAPAVPGEYLLLMDVISPVHGPLSANGGGPAIIRVSVARAGLLGPPAAPRGS